MFFSGCSKDMDSAFILGRGGKTKHKIARVSGATLELHEHNCTCQTWIQASFAGCCQRRLGVTKFFMVEGLQNLAKAFLSGVLKLSLACPWAKRDNSNCRFEVFPRKLKHGDPNIGSKILTSFFL